MQQINDEPTHDAAWRQLRPWLDAAMRELPAGDRDAIVLRFFESRTLADVGTRLRLSENAARMRLDRALDRLRAHLQRRGVESTSAALGLALTHQAVVAAPAGLAAAVTSGALSSAATAGTSFLLMSLPKLPTAIACALALAGAGTWWQHQVRRDLEAQLAAHHRQTEAAAALTREIAHLRQLAAEQAALRASAAALPGLDARVTALRARTPAPAGAPRLGTAARAAGTATPNVLNPAQLDHLPRPLAQTPPQFPVEYRQIGLPGSAQIAFVVEADGSVRDADVASASEKEFGEAARAAVATWKFEAGRKDGVPVATGLVVPVVFSIEGSVPDWF
jgi:TonB family protein